MSGMAHCHQMIIKSLISSRVHPRQSIGRTVPSKRLFVAAAADDARDTEKLNAMQAAMANPDTMRAMQEAMANPQVQQQMQQMAEVMSNSNIMSRAAELRDDPELKPIFDEIRAGGMAAMMKYMNDETFLSKIGSKMGDVIPSEEGVAAASAAPPAAATSPQPEIYNILDAAKYGDIEAIEDYIAIQKGDLTDENNRTALHYAVAYNQGRAAAALLENNADLNAQDAQGNTPLHFAAGYGRMGAVRALIQRGSNVKIKNEDGQTAYEVVKQEPRNPINKEEELLSMLENGL